MWGRWPVVVVLVLVVVSVEVALIRSTLKAVRSDLRQRPNCAQVDDAMRRGEVPDPKVRAACRASARGLIYSLEPGDVAALRRR